MSIHSDVVELGEVPVFPRPLKPVEDGVLIIYSVAKTDGAHKDAVVSAVNEYRRPDIRPDRPPDPQRFVRTLAKVFEIPAGAPPGTTLATELTRELKICVGAIAFVDDLRPNIAYELGFFHGKGAPVLLLTTRAPTQSWRRLSDLAGAALARFGPDTITRTVHGYLDRLFDYLERVDTWPNFSLPRSSYNLLMDEEVELVGKKFDSQPDAAFGRIVSIDLWDKPLDLLINKRLSPEARFSVALRSPAEAPYSVYFEVAFHDAHGQDRNVWLGLSSWLRRADFRNDERNLPADPASKQWRYLTGTFSALLQQAYLHKVRNITLRRVRFRAGDPHSTTPSRVEIGYVDILGLLG